MSWAVVKIVASACIALAVGALAACGDEDNAAEGNREKPSPVVLEACKDEKRVPLDRKNEIHVGGGATCREARELYVHRFPVPAEALEPDHSRQDALELAVEEQVGPWSCSAIRLIDSNGPINVGCQNGTKEVSLSFDACYYGNEPHAPGIENKVKVSGGASCEEALQLFLYPAPDNREGTFGPNTDKPKTRVLTEWSCEQDLKAPNGPVLFTCSNGSKHVRYLFG